VINARTDIYLKCVGNAINRFSHAVHRGNSYLLAGADCVFVPGVSDANTILELVQQIKGPLNILAVSGTPRIDQLSRLGVARVTFGSGPLRATLGLLERIAHELRVDGAFDSMISGAISFANTKAMFR
jgi:2-methylisocitrate lyase-like PEP mutase family enzyme